MSRMTEETRTERWVAKINRMSIEMDDEAASIHPSAWPEIMHGKNEQFKKCAALNAAKGE